MTEDKTITDNEVIARFMGLMVFQTWAEMQAFPIEKLQRWVLPEQCKYGTSWDWLMPVVEKITRHVYDEEEVDDGLGGKRIAKYTAYLRTFGMLSSDGKQMVRFNRSPIFEADTLIDATYQAVVDWIRWYNTQSKTNG